MGRERTIAPPLMQYLTSCLAWIDTEILCHSTWHNTSLICPGFATSQGLAYARMVSETVSRQRHVTGDGPWKPRIQYSTPWTAFAVYYTGRSPDSHSTTYIVNPAMTPIRSPG